MAITLIAHTEVGSGGAANIEFTSIPGTYDDLWLVTSLRSDNTNLTYNFTHVRFNGETTATNYSMTDVYGWGGSASSTRESSQNRLPTVHASATTTASTFSSSSFLIPNYKNTTNHKQIIIDNVWEINGTTNYYVGGRAALWRNTAAISSIRLVPLFGTPQFVQYSTATLYGITKF